MRWNFFINYFIPYWRVQSSALLWAAVAFCLKGKPWPDSDFIIHRNTAINLKKKSKIMFMKFSWRPLSLSLFLLWTLPQLSFKCLKLKLHYVTFYLKRTASKSFWWSIVVGWMMSAAACPHPLITCVCTMKLQWEVRITALDKCFVWGLEFMKMWTSHVKNHWGILHSVYKSFPLSLPV